ncbi:hypothetical protein HZH68_000968 [Vespula germanica]|uniref:Uncharacterized protein n=1 Tax=Vespula germanica TaxID=30212 RepID=A0A834NUI9_VESGE|nr:hypothetical protein HZH68_000968 [Vespula germanica]
MIPITYSSTKDSETTSGILTPHYLLTLGLERTSIDSSLNADLQNNPDMLAGLTLRSVSRCVSRRWNLYLRFQVTSNDTKFRHLDTPSKETNLDFDLDTVSTGDHIHEETTRLITGLANIITNLVKNLGKSLPYVVTKRTEIRIADQRTSMQFLVDIGSHLKSYAANDITIAILEVDILKRHKFIVDLTNRKMCNVQTTFEQMMQKGICRLSFGIWVSPINLAPTSTGQWRVYGDYRINDTHCQ